MSNLCCILWNVVFIYEFYIILVLGKCPDKRQYVGQTTKIESAHAHDQKILIK